jgi:hypothetical protein
LAKAASSLLNSCRSRENGGLERYGLGLAIPLLQVHWVGFITHVLHISSVLIFVMFCSHLISICLFIHPSNLSCLSHWSYLSVLSVLFVQSLRSYPTYLIHLIHPFYLIYLQCLNCFSILSYLSYHT